VVSVLATGPKVRGFKPGRGRRIFKGDKIRSTPSFGGEVSRRSHVVDLRHVKEPYEHDRCSSAKFSHVSHPRFTASLLDGRRIRIEKKSTLYSLRY
jgi:hypothetical protein